MRNRRGTTLLLTALLAALIGLAGCSSSDSGDEGAAPTDAQGETVIATGETGSGTGSAGEEPAAGGDALTVGWLFQATDSLDSVNALESALGGRVQSVVEENAADDPAAAAESVAAQGAGIVLSAVAGACAAVPDVPCIEPGGASEQSPDAVTLDDGFWNRAYLLGRAAGLLTESDQIGFFAEDDSPPQKAAVNAFALGCQGSNNNCQVRLAVAPENVKKALQVLKSSQVDVIATTLFNPALCNAGSAMLAVQPVLSPGDPCGNAYAVAPLAAAAEPLVQAVLDGSWEPGGSSTLALGDWADSVADDVRASVEERSAEIDQGENVFDGPLFDNQGTQQLAEGEALSSEFIASQWDWLLGGVIEQGG
jgi:basic membrane protein A and related proteins